jgi:hypothetical protein
VRLEPNPQKIPSDEDLDRWFEHIFSRSKEGHCQSKFVYFAKTSEPDFAAINFPAFFRVDLSGSMAAPSI